MHEFCHRPLQETNDEVAVNFLSTNKPVNDLTDHKSNLLHHE